MEALGAAKCACAERFDLRLGNSGFDELPQIVRGQIQTPGGLHPKAARHLLADLVATGANSRSDGDENIVRMCAERLLHPVERCGSDSRRSAAPSGVDGRDRSMNGIRQ